MSEAENLENALKTLKSKNHLVVKKCIISSYSMAENTPKIAEMKLSSCGLDSTAENMPKIAETKLSSCRPKKNRPKKKLRLWNCGVAVVEQHCFKKLRNCDCGGAFIKLQNCDCGLKKKLRVPSSADL